MGQSFKEAKMTYVTMPQVQVIEACEKCMKYIRKYRDSLWKERYEFATTRWKFWRYKGTLEEYKAEPDHIRSPEYDFNYEYQTARNLLRFARATDPSVPINIAMDDLGPVLKILDWVENGPEER